jgi:AcrR family transcriptional regulator
VRHLISPPSIAPIDDENAMHDGQPTRQQYLGDRLSRRILACTREVIAEVGIRDATMNQIALRAGCGKPTVYRRWPNIEALARAAIDDLIVSADLRGRFLQAAAAADALMEHPDGRFLFEVALLPSGRQRIEG